MSDKKFLNLFILCAILSQGIIGTFANDDIKKSLDTLSRQKRVFSLVPGEDKSVRITDVPYITVIKYLNRVYCVGSILSNHVVITIATCLRRPISDYHIISSTARPHRGNTHNITGVRKHFGNPQLTPVNGVALLTVDPPIVYTRYVKHIELHSGPLLAGTLATVSGWGFNCRNDRENRGTSLPRSLRSIEVPIISHRDCVNRYHAYYRISDQDVCTYHPDRHCGHNDFGAPLVIEGALAGLYLWSGPIMDDNDPQFPDVYVILQHLVYHGWIMSNVQNITAQFENQHH